MRIAILGSAPSSIGLAPFSDPSFAIWACSPGAYPHLARVDAFFELHRVEFGEVGKPHTQKPWFSPEYVQWMGKQTCPIWMREPVPQIPTSRALPIERLTMAFGNLWWTSSIAYMLAMAIEAIIEERKTPLGTDGKARPPDAIALFGVDMSATEEYGFQRAGCQRFLEIAGTLGIEIMVPPESDLMRPMPAYGLMESEHWHIKLMARQRELTARMNNAQATMKNAEIEFHMVRGALDDLDYIMKTWAGERPTMGVSVGIYAEAQAVKDQVMAMQTLPVLTDVVVEGTNGNGYGHSAAQAMQTVIRQSVLDRYEVTIPPALGW